MTESFNDVLKATMKKQNDSLNKMSFVSSHLSDIYNDMFCKNHSIVVFPNDITTRTNYHVLNNVLTTLGFKIKPLWTSTTLTIHVTY